ncbi:wax ester/triacylglycerol synthase family O-acyltransferase [Rhodocyclus tenuis]|uniref:wax ester/triacylglycerol synthase family O-acyltransferase n=1 Tax=Rhodocyclus tenuis TaxID=1066 RepID=UPI0019076A92|nr:wax ester/triacylglycerol synthase family O-acyltransferase [Rhodocyclus tenuis]MBK1679418.1 hypothetical protein [Rhodocyclus tenuis]
MSHRERMSHVDTAWLRMDRPVNLMQIVGVMVFGGKLDFARLRRVVAHRLLRYRRFRQIAVVEDNGAWWVDDPAFSLDAHLRRSLLPAPAGKAELQQFVSELIANPLNPARPRWEFNLVELADGNSAMVVRIHHAIADGIALVGVITSLTDADAAAEDAADDEKIAGLTLAASADDDWHENDVFWRHLYEPISEATLASIRIGSSLWSKYFEMLLSPTRAFDYARIVASFTQEIAKLALMPNDTPTRFKGRPGTAKCVAWSEPIPLPEMKAVSKVLGCSINDLLLSSAAGALCRYLAEHGELAPDTEIRALVPVNLRPPGDIGELGNRFGLVALEHSLGIENPLARLYVTRQRMEALKESYQAALTFSILGVVGMVPKFLQQKVLDLLANKATAVMTNVPGPQQARYLAGSRIAQQMFWVPQSGDIGMGLSILSYDGKVQLGLITDQGMVPDPEKIVERFAVEFEKLLWLVLMEPWERLDQPQAVEEALQAASESQRRFSATEESAATAARPAAVAATKKPKARARPAGKAGDAKDAAPHVAKETGAPARARRRRPAV